MYFWYLFTNNTFFCFQNILLLGILFVKTKIGPVLTLRLFSIWSVTLLYLNMHWLRYPVKTKLRLLKGFSWFTFVLKAVWPLREYWPAMVCVAASYQSSVRCHVSPYCQSQNFRVQLKSWTVFKWYLLC